MAKYLSIYLPKLQKSLEQKTLSTDKIETVFNKIMSPIRKEADPNLISQFTTLINNQPEKSQLALDMIVNKMQSQQEWEIIAALQVIEAVVKNCGETMHDLISRYRFLNEMIKLVSPKFYADRTTEKVKKKCIELLFCWSRDLPRRKKFKDAYRMLKSQGLVIADPVYVEKLVVNVSPRPTSKLVENEQMIANLLKSKNPKDLELANQLIKEMFYKEEINAEKTSQRDNELEQINNGMKLLNEMLNEYETKKMNNSEKETIFLLYGEVQNMLPKIIKLATESNENDTAIGDILNSLDQCSKMMSKFTKLFKNGPETNADDDLVDLSSPIQESIPKNNSAILKPKDLNNAFMEELFLIQISESKENNTIDKPMLNNLDILKPEILSNTANKKPSDEKVCSNLGKNQGKIKALDDLNELGRMLMETTLKSVKKPL